jgi:hypothetical protein
MAERNRVTPTGEIVATLSNLSAWRWSPARAVSATAMISSASVSIGFDPSSGRFLVAANAGGDLLPVEHR